MLQRAPKTVGIDPLGLFYIYVILHKPSCRMITGMKLSNPKNLVNSKCNNAFKKNSLNSDYIQDYVK